MTDFPTHVLGPEAAREVGSNHLDDSIVSVMDVVGGVAELAWRAGSVLERGSLVGFGDGRDGGHHGGRPYVVMGGVGVRDAQPALVHGESAEDLGWGCQVAGRVAADSQDRFVDVLVGSFEGFAGGLRVRRPHLVLQVARSLMQERMEDRECQAGVEVCNCF